MTHTTADTHSKASSKGRVKTKAPIWRRFLVRVLSLLITVTFFAAASLSIYAGTQAIAKRAAEVETPAPAPAVFVQSAIVEYVNSYTIDRRFVGQIEAAQTVDAAFEQGGEVRELLVDEGDQISGGQVLARLDTRLLEAERDRLEAAYAAIEAQIELAQRTAERQAELKERGFATTQTTDETSLRVVELTARLAEIDASLAGVDIRLEKSVLYAPFAGQVAARQVDKGSQVAPGQPLLELLETDEPRFRVGLDPDVADMVRGAGEVSIDIRGATYQARFFGLLPGVDPVTRTRQAIFELASDAAVVFGDTGHLVLRQAVEERGAWLPLTALNDGVRGTWSVLIAEPSNDDQNVDATVRTEAVQLIYAAGDRVFVAGTFRDGAAVITDGGHRVVPGQRVRLTHVSN